MPGETRRTVHDQALEDSRTFEAGLDALDAPPALPPQPNPWAVFVRSVLPPIVAAAAFVGLWQLAYAADLKQPYALPSPLDVLESSMVGPGRRSLPVCPEVPWVFWPPW
jgi:hypothetical protein